MRFEEGTQECVLCHKKENIIQYELDKVIKKLPVTEITFLCVDCARKKGLPIPIKEVKE